MLDAYIIDWLKRREEEKRRQEEEQRRIDVPMPLPPELLPQPEDQQKKEKENPFVIQLRKYFNN